MRLLLFIGILFGITSMAMAQKKATARQQIGADIQLIPLTENTMIHRSYKVFENFGRVGCNGLIYIADSSIVIFDTPVTEKTTARLLQYLIDESGYTVEAVVINHFHEDCLAGIDSVHARGILTYGSRKTVARCKAEGYTPPQKKFGRKKTLKLGDKTIVNYHPGAAHSSDNIVSYVPSERVLFGGCMLKSNGAGKGNLADASVEDWSNSAEKVRKQFPDAEYLVPGHGHHGGPELLQYTIDLFADDRKK
ncbi:MAG: subclass B1 metallo-beta-lactamase [Bacteroidota bacterium]